MNKVKETNEKDKDSNPSPLKLLQEDGTKLPYKFYESGDDLSLSKLDDQEDFDKAATSRVNELQIHQPSEDTEEKFS